MAYYLEWFWNLFQRFTWVLSMQTHRYHVSMVSLIPYSNEGNTRTGKEKEGPIPQLSLQFLSLDHIINKWTQTWRESLIANNQWFLFFQYFLSFFLFGNQSLQDSSRPYFLRGFSPTTFPLPFLPLLPSFLGIFKASPLSQAYCQEDECRTRLTHSGANVSAPRQTLQYLRVKVSPVEHQPNIAMANECCTVIGDKQIVA